MKQTRLLLPVTALIFAAAAFSCGDDMSQIGSSLTTGENTISIDTLKYDLKAVPVENKNFDSRSGNLLLGNINVPEYGELNCSFVTRMMPVSKLPARLDTIKLEQIDSCKLLLGIARGNLTGDSLAPQRLTVYRLNKQLPEGITNTFDPTGYYDPKKPLGSQSFTVSAMAKSDSLFNVTDEVSVYVPLPKDMATEVFNLYKNNPGVFAWPQTFAEQYLPGLYIESSFGNGCVANISQAIFSLYYHVPVTTTTTVDGTTTSTTRDVAYSEWLFTTAPEVLSSNNIKYNVSDKIQGIIDQGKTVITTPGGYTAKFTLPIREVIRDYENKEHNLMIISNLLLNLPASAIENDFGIGVAPYMLLIKTSEVDEFFRNNKLPDNKTSFSAVYDYSNKRYQYNGLREYLLNMMAKGTVTDDDVDFSLIPVQITTEEVSSGYYGSQTTSYVTGCTPYAIRPTMTFIDTQAAEMVFSFSSQIIK